jgi:hypothetical protein
MNEITDFGPNRTLEILRRLCLIIGVLVTAWAIVKPADALFRVRDVNFAKRQKQDAQQMRSGIKMISRVSGMELDPNDPTINTAPTLTLEQYIAKKTANSLIEVSGLQWAQFFTDVQQTLSGKATTFARHLNADSSSLFMLYFHTDTSPLKELDGRLGDNNEFTYVALRDGNNIYYIEVLYQRPQSAFHDAPNWLLYPLREYAVWWFIAGLLAYAAIPWYRKGPDELRYITARSMVTPDFLGAFLALFFFTLPILVITTNAVSSEPIDVFGFTNGWWPLTLAMWLLACHGLAALFVGLWYACFTLQITPTGLRLRKLTNSGDYGFADMEAIEPAHWAWPRWLRIIAILIGLLNWRLLGAIMIGSSEEAYGIAIRTKDGRKLKLWMTHLPGFSRIFRALRNANVPLDPELAKITDENIAEPETERKPGKAGKVAAGILMTLAIAGALTWQYWPANTRIVKHELRFSYEQLAQRRELLNEMMKVATQMKNIGGTAEFDKLMKQHDALEKKYEAIQPTEED